MRDPHPIYIRENCWIGSGAIIGENVAKNTTVGAGAVVTKTYGEGKTLVGVPAKPIKK